MVNKRGLFVCFVLFFSYSTDSVNCKAPPKRKNVNKLLESVLFLNKKKKSEKAQERGIIELKKKKNETDQPVI